MSSSFLYIPRFHFPWCSVRLVFSLFIPGKANCVIQEPLTRKVSFTFLYVHPTHCIYSQQYRDYIQITRYDFGFLSLSKREERKKEMYRVRRQRFSLTASLLLLCDPQDVCSLMLPESQDSREIPALTIFSIWYFTQ